MGVEVELRELRLVVEHFLEVRHEPFGIHRVTREPAAQLVVNAAGGHAVAGVQHHARGFVIVKTFRAAQQQRWQAGLRKFGRAAETAVARVEHPLEKFARVFERFLRRKQIPRVRIRGGGFKARMDFVRRTGDFIPAGLPDFVDLPEQLQKARTAVSDCPAGNRCRRKTASVPA